MSAHNLNPVLQGFIEVIRSLPAANAEVSHRELPEAGGAAKYDARLAVHIAGKSYDVVVEEKKSVYPRDVREVLWQLRQYLRHEAERPNSETTIALLIADSISPGAKELLREEHFAYYDSGGSLFFPAAGAYLFIDKPSPKSFEKESRALYSDRRAQVLHALLADPETWRSVKDLAENAKVSTATASQVLTELGRFDWLSERGQGPRKERMLREPSALLNAWAHQRNAVRLPPPHRYFVPEVTANALIDVLSKVFRENALEYAISYEAAAQIYAPFLSDISTVRCRLQRGLGIEAAIQKIGARSVNKGANLELVEVKSAGDLLFRQKSGEIWLASPIQVYLDLLRSEGRAKEMAEHLRKEKIKF
jgi:hypothetical protein